MLLIIGYNSPDLFKKLGEHAKYYISRMFAYIANHQILEIIEIPFLSIRKQFEKGFSWRNIGNNVIQEYQAPLWW